MRSLLNAVRNFTTPIVERLDDWRYDLFGPTNRELQREIEMLRTYVRGRLSNVEAEAASCVAVIERIEAPRRALGPILVALADHTDAEAIELIRTTIASLKAQGKL